jgi:hypothetical protein
VLPRKTGALAVSAPDAVSAGRDLVADIALAGAVGQQVFHVEVVPPSGEVRFHMKRNLKARDGRARLVFRMAENDARGRWKLTVRDALTGTACEKAFTVVGN